MSGNIYHEKQIRRLCALHALNNLFQENTFTKEQLDDICNNLTPNVWINPHRSMLGLGNYDINVIMKALLQQLCEVVWFDKRKDPSCIDLDALIGFIINVPSDYKIGFVTLPFHRRHWIAVRRIGDSFYDLDSKLNAPERIGAEEELLTYLRKQLDTNKCELFLVMKQENNKSNANDETRWIKASIDASGVINGTAHT